MKRFEFDAVVFDMDGLLIDTETIARRAWKHSAKEFAFVLEDPFYSKLIGRNRADNEKLFYAEFGDDFPYSEARALKDKFFEESCLEDGVSLMPGAINLLDSLISKEIPIALATSTHREPANRMLELTELNSFFNISVCGDEIENGKPAPDIYIEASSKLKVNPENCIAFEDSNAGMISATAAGMTAIMVPGLSAPEKNVRELAHEIIESLEHSPSILFTEA